MVDTLAQLEVLPVEAGGHGIAWQVQGFEIPQEFLHGCRCDLCGVDRYRSQMWVLSDESGNLTRVGSTCYRRAYGENPPQSAPVDRGEEHASPGAGFEVLGFVARAVTVIRTYGWVSSRDSYEKGLVSTAVRCRNSGLSYSDEDLAQAKELLTWALSLGGDFETFEGKVSTLAKCDYLAHDKIAPLAYLPIMHSRAKERESAVNEYVGQVGKKWSGELTVKKTIRFLGHYGASYLHIMADNMGRTFTWKASGKELEVGTYAITGTVKEHTEFRGVRQTVLTRCKVERK